MRERTQNSDLNNQGELSEMTQPVVSKSNAPAVHGKNATILLLFARVYASARRRVKKFWSTVDRKLMLTASRSGRASSWYYALFNRSFDREHRAVLCGRLAFEGNREGPMSTSSLLRRNIHRLEKGLLYRPRRDIFGEDYILETVEFFDAAVNRRVHNRVTSMEELEWAGDVLREFFSVTGTSPRLDAARLRFAEISKIDLHQTKTDTKTPYTRNLNGCDVVKYDDLLALAWQRRSVRWFLQKPVPRELIERSLAVASLSPSACNRQPFVFRVFDDPEQIRRVAALPGGTQGFHDNFPAIIVVLGELRNYQDERDRHVPYVDASLAAMAFVYAAETLGLATCCINWPDIEADERRAEELLQLEPDQRPVMFIAVGYPDPDGLVAYSQKKPSIQICRYNFD